MSELLKGLAEFGSMVQSQVKAIAEAEEQEGEEAQTTTQSTAFGAAVDLAYLVAAADGTTSPEELGHIKDRVAELTDSIPPEVVDFMLTNAKLNLETSGEDAFLSSVTERLDDEAMRETAFLVAANVSWTGGGIGAQEGLKLQAIARAFGWEISKMHQLLGKARG